MEQEQRVGPAVPLLMLVGSPRHVAGPVVAAGGLQPGQMGAHLDLELQLENCALELMSVAHLRRMGPPAAAAGLQPMQMGAHSSLQVRPAGLLLIPAGTQQRPASPLAGSVRRGRVGTHSGPYLVVVVVAGSTKLAPAHPHPMATH